jgi:hypothetical protein
VWSRRTYRPRSAQNARFSQAGHSGQNLAGFGRKKR